MDQKKSIKPWRKRNVPIFVQTSSLIPFDDFLAETRTENLNVTVFSGKHLTADFEFRWVFMEVKWSASFEYSLTLKHLLYLYYHHIFGIRTYAVSKNINTEEEQWTIIDERTRLYKGIPDVSEIKHPHRPAYTPFSETESIFPIRIWQENEDFLNEIKSVLGKFSPNKGYDRVEVEEAKAELSLREGEIFEYFLSASKHGYEASFSDIRKHLAERWLDDNAPEEILKKRVAFVDRFLSSIIQ